MDRKQIENLYLVNGLKDYRLKTEEDLIKTHGIDYRAVEGYNRLDDLNKQLYGKFILNIFNAWGLEARATLIPKGIYYVEDTDYLVKEQPGDEYYTVAGGIVKAIDKNGVITVLHNWIHDDYKHLEIIQGEIKRYLRFEYQHEGRNEWLHVINDHSWY